MKSDRRQHVLIAIGSILLLASPFIAYFGSRFTVRAYCDTWTLHDAWCGQPVDVVIGAICLFFGMSLVGAALVLAALLLKRKTSPKNTKQ